MYFDAQGTIAARRLTHTITELKEWPNFREVGTNKLPPPRPTGHRCREPSLNPSCSLTSAWLDGGPTACPQPVGSAERRKRRKQPSAAHCADLGLLRSPAALCITQHNSSVLGVPACCRHPRCPNPPKFLSESGPTSFRVPRSLQVHAPSSERR